MSSSAQPGGAREFFGETQPESRRGQLARPDRMSGPLCFSFDSSQDRPTSTIDT